MLDDASYAFLRDDLAATIARGFERQALDRHALQDSAIRARLTHDIGHRFTLSTVDEVAAELSTLLPQARAGDWRARDAILARTAALTYCESVAIDRMMPEVFRPPIIDIARIEVR